MSPTLNWGVTINSGLLTPLMHLTSTGLTFLQADKERFGKLDAEKTGRAAKTVYRDKEMGTRLEGGAEELQAQLEAKRPKHEKPAWGGGIAQVPEFF